MRAETHVGVRVRCPTVYIRFQPKLECAEKFNKLLRYRFHGNPYKGCVFESYERTCRRGVANRHTSTTSL